MHITVKQADMADRDASAGLIERYIREMVTYIGVEDLSAEQLVAYSDMLNDYWELPDHCPLLIRCDQQLSGFSLVRRYPPDPDVYDMGQFYVADEHKGQGIGRRAFQQTLARFPGRWLVRVLPANTRAFAFWNRVIDELTEGNFTLTTQSDNRELEKHQEMHCFRFSTSMDLPGPSGPA
jgi:predicted acetyltransferase